MIIMLLCDISDEDFESAVKALNGKLYPDTPEKKSASFSDGMLIILFFSHLLMLPVLIFVVIHVQIDSR